MSNSLTVSYVIIKPYYEVSDPKPKQNVCDNNLRAEAKLVYTYTGEVHE